jgi:K+-transporting ATPase KdpF subunit
MSVLYLIGGSIALGLLGYLVVALLKPVLPLPPIRQVG